MKKENKQLLERKEREEREEREERDHDAFVDGLNEDFENWKAEGRDPAEWWP